jgi:YgiT-type zinc finger domain-containing protein
MKCVYCQGTMKRDVTSYNINRRGYHLLLDKVAAWVCTQCGEAYFEEQEVKSIQDLIGAIDQQISKLPKSA